MPRLVDLCSGCLHEDRDHLAFHEDDAMNRCVQPGCACDGFEAHADYEPPDDPDEFDAMRYEFGEKADANGNL